MGETDRNEGECVGRGCGDSDLACHLPDGKVVKDKVGVSLYAAGVSVPRRWVTGLLGCIGEEPPFGCCSGFDRPNRPRLNKVETRFPLPSGLGELVGTALWEKERGSVGRASLEIAGAGSLRLNAGGEGR